MVSDDMRLFFLDAGAVRRALTEIRSVPHSLTAEEWTVEPFEWVKTKPCAILASPFLFLAGTSRRRLAVPTRSCWSCQTNQFPQQLKNLQKIQWYKTMLFL